MHSIQQHAGRGEHPQVRNGLARSLALAGALAAALATLVLTAQSAQMDISFFLSDPMMWAVLSLAAVAGLCAGGLAGLRIQRLLQGVL